MNGSTKLFGTNINFGANFDPYALDTTKTGQPITVNKYMLNEHKKIARLTDANLSFSLRFDSKKFKRKKEKGSKDVITSYSIHYTKLYEIFVEENARYLYC